ncbi:YesL family protein [Lactococcus fujiensis]|nr:YesL family protein [Lactococcus fujiensis]
MDKLLSIDSPVMKGLTFVVNLVLLNILFILTSLPIITVGASLCALQTSIQNILHKKDSSITKNYLRIFKANFKNSTLFYLVTIFLTGIMYLDFRLISRFPIVVKYGIGMTIILIILSLIILMSYYYAYIGRYENSIKTTLKNIGMISLQNLFQTIFLVIYNIFIIYFTFSSPASLITMIYFGTFIGFALINLGSGIIIKQVFDKIEVKKFN